jgi:hypothetical protein
MNYTYGMVLLNYYVCFRKLQDRAFHWIVTGIHELIST